MYKKLAAWSVHLFTATGLLAAFMALLAAVEHDWRSAMLWLVVCQFVDGIDGTFARMAKVREVLPYVQGKYIDYVIDFFTYAILPAYIFFEWTELSYTLKLIATFAMLLSAALYYGIENMTSATGKHFVGFPVMWNVVVFLLIFVLPPLPNAFMFGAIIALAVLHFVPIHFAYPSMGGRWWPATLAAAAAAMVSAIIILFYYPTPQPIFRWVTLVALSYFILLAILDTYDAWSGKLDHKKSNTE